MIEYLDTHKYPKSGSSHNDIEMIEEKGAEGISPTRDLKNVIQPSPISYAASYLFRSV